MPSKAGKARRTDAVFAIMVLIVSLVFLSQAWKLPPSRFDPLGPGSFPIAVCLLLAALALVALALAFTGRDLGRAETSMILGVGEAGEGTPRPWLGVFVFAATAAYALVLGYLPVGFFWATAVFIFVAGLAMSDRSRRSAAIALLVGIGVSGTLTLGFGHLLGFPLP